MNRLALSGVEERSPRKLKIELSLAFREGAAVRLLNWLAQEDALIMRERSDLPLLYDSGVRYEREKTEQWLDTIMLYEQGFEDCDGLSAARAGELMARGWKALGPEDGGYHQAQRERPTYIEARPFLRTRTVPGKPGMYHCIVRYRVGDHWYRDDPSARLGMFQGEHQANPWGSKAEPKKVSRKIAGPLKRAPSLESPPAPLPRSLRRSPS